MREFTRLVLCIHNHQPLGTPDDVIEQAYRQSYEPFLSMLSEFPDVALTMHVSGGLLEWCCARHPEYVDALRVLVGSGQLELLGGPIYEPVLAGIPREDVAGQIRLYSSYLDRLFGQEPRGMWMPERVWHPGLTRELVDAGMQYTLLDETHFHDLPINRRVPAYEMTEQEGRLLRLFRGSEFWRNRLTREPPERTIHDLRDRLHPQRFPGGQPVVAVGDDGAKYGLWPGSQETVFQAGWLRTFFGQICEQGEWLRAVTMSSVVDQVPPTARCYFAAAYPGQQSEPRLSDSRSDPDSCRDEDSGGAEPQPARGDGMAWQQALSAGDWRRCLLQYAESNELYARMMEVSRRLQRLKQSVALEQQHTTDAAELLEAARDHLYRGQANAPYWHGASAGIYDPQLRQAAFAHIIAADNLLERVSRTESKWVEATVRDFDFDARPEVRLANDRLIGYLAPSRGGHLYELDVRSIQHNLLAGLDRRPEPYHRRLAGPQDSNVPAEDSTAMSATADGDAPQDVQPGPYDRWPRKSLVDHFLQPGTSLEEFQTGRGLWDECTDGGYQSRLRESSSWVELCMRRSVLLGGRRIDIQKTVRLDSASGHLHARYELAGMPPEQELWFAVEFNLAGMSTVAEDAYYYDAAGRQLGSLDSVQSLASVERIGATDERIGLDVALEASQPATVWTFPIQTVSQSQRGTEFRSQSCCVIPHWRVVPHVDGRWQVSLTLSIDTAAAQARQLSDLAAAYLEPTPHSR